MNIGNNKTIKEVFFLFIVGLEKRKYTKKRISLSSLVTRF